MIRVFSAVAIGAGALLIACLPGYLFSPMGRDQGMFAWVGDEICRGGVPYRDAWEVKGPATHYLFAAAQSFFGPTLWAIRAVDIVLLGLSMAAMYRLALNLSDRTLAWFPALLWPLAYLHCGYWHTAQSDGWAAMALLASFALVSGLAVRSVDAVAGGACLGLAVLFKLPFAIFLGPLLVMACWGRLSDGVIRIASAVVAGMASVLGSAVILLYMCDALEAAIEVQWGFNRIVHQNMHEGGLGRHQTLVVAFFTRGGNVVLSALALFGIVSAWFVNRRNAATLGGLLLTAIVCTAIQNKYYLYHWLPVYAALVLAAGVGLRRLVELIDQRSQGTKWWGASAWVFAATAMVLIASHRPSLNRVGVSAFVLGTVSPEHYFKTFSNKDLSSDVRYPIEIFSEIARHVAVESTPDRTVLSWGSNPIINFLAQRASPTRFGFNYALVVSEGTPYFDRYRREFMDRIRARPPLFVIIADNDTSNLLKKTSTQFFNEFTELREFVSDRYFQQRRIADYAIWKLRE